MVSSVKAIFVAVASVSSVSTAFRTRTPRKEKRGPAQPLLRVVLGGSMAGNGHDESTMAAFRGFPPQGVKYITAAATDPVSTHAETKEWLSKQGIEAEWIPVYAENCAERTQDPAFVQMVEDADAIFLAGGQSGRLTSCLFGNYSESGIEGGVETPFLKALQAKAVVGGFSAGAMAQASEILVSGHSAESYAAVRQGSVFRRSSGSSLLADAQAVDTHFSERGRQGRLMVFAMQTAKKFAFGIDEGTALIWRSSGDYEVKGAGGVAVFRDTEGTEKGQSSMMHYLTNGDRTSRRTGRITFNDDKTMCATGEAPTGSNSIFNGEGANTFKTTSTAAAKAKLGTTVHNYHGNPPVQVTFTKVVDTVAMCGPSGESFEHLLVEQSASAATEVNTDEPNVALDHIYSLDE